jgi:hypothetical protein
MSREADALQAKYQVLATKHDYYLEAMLHPNSLLRMPLEEQAMYLMEFVHRIAPQPRLAKLCWQIVHGDSRPYPIGLLPPSLSSSMTPQLRARCIAAQQLSIYGPEVMAQARALS